MKKTAVVMAMVVALAAVSAAAENQVVEKDWCLLGVSSKCNGTTYFDLFEKIRRINIALQLGSSVYTPEEIKHLEVLLSEAERTREILETKR